MNFTLEPGCHGGVSELTAVADLRAAPDKRDIDSAMDRLIQKHSR
jgi:hypothetical protein